MLRCRRGRYKLKALEDFSKDLLEVKLLLNETRKALESAESAGTSIERAENLFRANTFSRSGIVLLCGHFEGFLRKVINEFSTRFNTSGVRAEAIPYEVLETTLSHILQKCTSGSENHRKQLKDLISGKAQIEMNASLFAKTEGNPKVEVIERILERVGVARILEVLTVRDFEITTEATRSQVDSSFKRKINDICQSISDNPRENSSIEVKIIELLDEKWPPKKTRRPVGYVATIQELLKRRNLIAHGDGDIKVTDMELEQFITEVSRLASGISEYLEDKLKELEGSKS